MTDLLIALIYIIGVIVHAALISYAMGRTYRDLSVGAIYDTPDRVMAAMLAAVWPLIDCVVCVCAPAILIVLVCRKLMAYCYHAGRGENGG